MNEKKETQLIQIGDVIEFKYRLKPINDDTTKIFKPEEIQKITIGKNELFDGLDNELVGKNSLDKFIEIQDFKMPNDHLMFPDQFVHIGIKILKHEKQTTKEIIEPSLNDSKNSEINKKDEIKELKEEKERLLEKISKLEIESHANLIAFKAKQEEISKRAQEEVQKIKQEIKEKAKEEIEHNKKYALQKFAESILEPLNNLYMSVEFGSNQQNEAISAYVKGFQLIVNQMFQILNDFGITIIEPKIGDLFNPEFDEVYEVIESKEFSKDQIIKVISRGYKLNDRTIKPSKVIVAK